MFIQQAIKTFSLPPSLLGGTLEERERERETERERQMARLMHARKKLRTVFESDHAARRANQSSL